MMTLMTHAPIYAKKGVSTTNCVILSSRQNIGMKISAEEEPFYAH